MSTTTMMFISAMSIVLSLLMATGTEAQAPALGEFRRPPLTNTRRRPDASGSATVFARWLVSESSFGVLATVDKLSAKPFNNVVSFADADTGVPFFYLSTLDPTGRNAANGTLASFSLTEAVLGYCDEDPQSPACAKITLSGTLNLLSGADAELGEAALFAKHPQFLGFPKASGRFQVYAMGINSIYLLNEKAPSKIVAVEDYFAAKF